MTDKAISPLRRRMIEDMTVRRLAPKTQGSYIRAVRDFSVFLGRSPDQASAADLRRDPRHRAASGVSVPSFERGGIAEPDGAFRDALADGAEEPLGARRSIRPM